MKILAVAAVLVLITCQTGYCQNTPDHLDSVMIQAFSQARSPDVAGNCASISVIKLAIRRYGKDGVFLNVDSLATEYNVKLRDGKAIVLTKNELNSIRGLDKFVYLQNPQIYKAALFIYGVMAKNRLLTQPNPGYYKTIYDVAYDRGNYQLIPDTVPNFQLLGIEQDLVKLGFDDANTTSGVITCSDVHSTYAGKGYYDEYGTFELFANFRQKHSRFFTRRWPSREIKYVYGLR